MEYPFLRFDKDSPPGKDYPVSLAIEISMTMPLPLEDAHRVITEGIRQVVKWRKEGGTFGRILFDGEG